MNLKTKEIGKVVGIMSLIFFILCIFWGVLITRPELKELHINLLQLFYPGYSFVFSGIILGLIEAYVYGWLIGAGFVWFCKRICK